MKKAAKFLPWIALFALAAVWIARKASHPSQVSPSSPKPHGSAPPPEVGTTLPASAPTGVLWIWVMAAGKPVAGARILLLEVNGDGRTESETNADGQRRILEVPVGEQAVSVRVPGHTPYFRRWPIEAGRTTEVRVALERGGRLSGTVRTPQGAPLAEAYVTPVDPLNRSNKATDLRGTSGKDGRYEIDGIPPGPLGVAVFRKNYRPLFRGDLRINSPEDAQTLDIILQEGARISGRVVDPEGKPVRDAIVLANNEVSLAEPTGEDGRFDIQGLGDLPIGVSVRARGYGRLHRRSVPIGTLDLEIRLERGAGVNGTLEGDRPTEGYVVNLHRFDPDLQREIQVESSVFPSDKAVWAFTDLAPGAYRIEAEADGYTCEAPVNSALESGKTVNGVLIRMKRK